ncbi:MAG: YihY/virulence factor BrkB family protein [Flavobacteriales bacterium]|jgi:membrane protein|nr:YihY/virulence factor BrkB family protein [Flavobacteriales bacterium]HJN64464.1 YihY/virulence factor BrkB family protein [Flavobacteriales bacterium]|tara:strand:+ start:149 stop:1045 length:897 start_codon:yes stop_codon:yes gene_type:complete
MKENFIIQLARRIKPIGFIGLSLYDVAIFFWRGLMEGAITTRASSLAFNFFLAFFPSIIVFFTLIPYIPIDSLQETLMELLAVVLPPSTNEITFQTLEDIISNPRGGLLSVGFILALYFSTNGINSLIEAFNSSYHIREIRPLIQQRILSLGLTLLLSIMLIIAIGLIIFGTVVVNYLVSSEIITTGAADLIIYGKWFVMLSMLFFGISILFHLGPALKSKWKLFTPGSIFATIFIIITSIGFNYYINHFSQYNKIYGSIGTLIIILLWMYFNSIILLTGFELNASISNAKQKRVDSE